MVKRLLFLKHKIQNLTSEVLPIGLDLKDKDFLHSSFNLVAEDSQRILQRFKDFTKNNASDDIRLFNSVKTSPKSSALVALTSHRHLALPNTPLLTNSQLVMPTLKGNSKRHLS